MGEKSRLDRGKWSQPGIPHKGWMHEDCIDLGEPSQICEMCESAEIRYAHVMRHVDYPQTLEVGCVCAENMSQDYEGPRRHEGIVRSAAKRKLTWPRKHWRSLFQGTWYLNTDGFNITIFATKGTYFLTIRNRKTQIQQPGKSRYMSLDEAKEAALIALLWAKENL